MRQLFDAGCIQSAFWHRFAATVHSPIGLQPKKYGIRLFKQLAAFARNVLPFEDPTGTDHDLLGEGLRKALYNYMHGVGLDLDVRSWFSGARPPRARGKGAPTPSSWEKHRPPRSPAQSRANALRDS